MLFEAGVSQLLTLIDKVKNSGEEMYQIANTKKSIRYKNHHLFGSNVGDALEQHALK